MFTSSFLTNFSFNCQIANMASHRQVNQGPFRVPRPTAIPNSQPEIEEIAPASSQVGSQAKK